MLCVTYVFFVLYFIDDAHCSQLYLLNADVELSTKLFKVFEPFFGLLITLLGLSFKFGIDALQYFIIVVLNRPEVHLKGERAYEVYRGLQIFEQEKIRGVVAEQVGHVFEIFPERILEDS